ncbi:HNH endonuclease [Streptomyces sp. NPDC056347]|uniref:HNH endonuclease n=1 Tax=Streptomyces sp. NPDC056347 TaxID=3345790 RepID=UPI0035DCF2AA
MAGRSSVTRFCSRACNLRTLQRGPTSRRTRARRKLRHAAEGRRGKRTWQQGHCIRCSLPFVGSAKVLPYCSADCQRSDDRDNRRARERDAFVAPVYRARIFERDSWTCQLCAAPVDRTAKVPAPHAPTIDHILPLANGGTHEPANVQTAHFICNCTKSNREGGPWLTRPVESPLCK